MIARRRLVASIAAILASPRAALSQPAKPVIGLLSTGSRAERAHMLDWFRGGLKQGGFVEGKDVTIVYQWAEGRAQRLPELAADLVKQKVSVIVTQGGAVAALAAKSATSTIPIVFLTSADPVAVGLVGSLSRPGGNVTGVANLGDQLEVKRLQILRELVPRTNRILYLASMVEPDAKKSIGEVLAAAELTNVMIDVVRVGNGGEIDAAFANFKQTKGAVLLVATSGLFTTRRDQIVALAARLGIPDSYSRREFVAVGGLMSYGPDYANVYRQVGMYAARILKGARPAEMPVIQETKFNLVLNLTTAKRLGLSVSRDFLARVDEVIH